MKTTTSKSIFFTLLLGFFSVLLPAQKGTPIEKSIESIQNEKKHKAKIQWIQKSIQEINNTDFDEIINLAQQGFELAKRQNDSASVGEFLRIIGGAYNRKGMIDSASTYYYKALQILEIVEDIDKLGFLYDDIARMYRKLQQTERALSFYDKALSLYEAQNNQEGIARIYNESGVVFREEGDYNEANRRFEKSLRIQRQRNDSVGIGYALEFLGYNQMLIKDFNKAESYLKQALEIREKTKDQFSTMLSYTSLGEYYKETNQYLLSNEYYEKSNELAKEINFIDIQTYNYERITENYEKLGDFKRAYENFRLYTELNDSIYNVQKLKDVEEITTKYETAEKENLILQQNAKISKHQLLLKNRSLWIFGLASLTLIIGLIGFLLYKQQLLKNSKQQKENELNLALEKIENQNRLQEQRLSISRDLHDNIGSQLTFIISMIDLLKYHITEPNEQLFHKLNNINSFAKETIQELRDTIWAMNKSEISLMDLYLRINDLIEKVKHSHPNTPISLLFKLEEKEKEKIVFDGLSGLNIFRIIQEAVNNALKYSEAQQITIQINKSVDGIQFQIKDNGKGYDSKEIKLGNGLMNMKKRATELKSELLIDTFPNKGTELSFKVNRFITFHES